MTKTEYDNLIKSKKKVVVDFNATWCAPCKDLKPKVEAAIAAMPDVLLVEVDIDESDHEIMKSVDIRSVPTLLVYEDGELKRRMVGNETAYKVRDFLEQA